jgi:hypothetical protein
MTFDRFVNDITNVRHGYFFGCLRYKEMNRMTERLCDSDVPVLIQSSSSSNLNVSRAFLAD